MTLISGTNVLRTNKPSLLPALTQNDVHFSLQHKPTLAINIYISQPSFKGTTVTFALTHCLNAVHGLQVGI